MHLYSSVDKKASQKTRGEQQLPPASILQSTVLASSPQKLRSEIKKKVPRTQALINARDRPTSPPQAPHKLLVSPPPAPRHRVPQPARLAPSVSRRHKLGSQTRTKWKQSQNVSDSLPKRQNIKSLENSPIPCHVPPSKMQKFFCAFQMYQVSASLKKEKKMFLFKKFSSFFEMGKRETGEKIWSVTREERQDGEA